MCCDDEPEKCPHWPALKRNFTEQTVMYWKVKKLEKRIKELESRRGLARRVYEKAKELFFGD